MPDPSAHSEPPASPWPPEIGCAGSPVVDEPHAAALATPSAELRQLLVRLRHTVAHYVAGRRGEGVSIARVLSEVRCVVREAESADGTFAGSQALLGQVMRWTVAAYHEGPAAPRLETPATARPE